MTRWTEPEDATLRALAAQGLSSGNIAARMGKSRNAVIGRALRAGIDMSRARKPSPGKRPVKASKSPVVKMERPVRPTQPVERPAMRLVTLLDLRANDCRWICEGTGAAARFCGAEKFVGQSYCAFHCQSAFIAFACEVAA